MFVTNLAPGSWLLDLRTGLAIGSRRRRDVPVTLDTERPRPPPATGSRLGTGTGKLWTIASPAPIRTMETPSSTKVSSSLFFLSVPPPPSWPCWLRLVPEVRRWGGALGLPPATAVELESSCSSPTAVGAAAPPSDGSCWSFLVFGGRRGGGVAFDGAPANTEVSKCIFARPWFSL